jgi:hypothetical protein
MEKCYYCQRQRATMRDHIVPRQHGGPDDYWNLVPVCAECNGMLSYYLPARDGDTIAKIRYKKELFLRSSRRALRGSSRWRKLSKEERWQEVCRGRWVHFLPRVLQDKYDRGRAANGRLVGKRRAARWRSPSSSRPT